MFAKYKKIIIVAVILVLGFVAWSIFIKPDPEAESLLVSDQPKEVDEIGKEIIGSLNKMKSLELDKSVFDHPIFMELTDYSRELQLDSVGRSNPFESFDGSSGDTSADIDFSDQASSESESESESESGPGPEGQAPEEGGEEETNTTQ